MTDVPSNSQLDTTLDVLRLCLAEEESDPAEVRLDGRLPRLRPVFRLLRAIFRRQTAKRLGGLDLEIQLRVDNQLSESDEVEEYIQSRVAAKRAAEVANRRESDRRLRDRCRLRAGREERRAELLQRLRARGDCLEPVPDGPVADPLTLLLPEEALQDKATICYVCKARYHTLHHFYDQLCPHCAELNWEKRHQTADLTGRVALVTGGRVKMGREVVLKLLTAGASVIATTRFPREAAKRYSVEPGFKIWGSRLSILPLDLLDLSSLESFCRRLPRLDILINNAAQTVRRRPEFYAQLADVKGVEIGEEARSLLALGTSGPVITSPLSPALALVTSPWVFNRSTENCLHEALPSSTVVVTSAVSSDPLEASDLKTGLSHSTRLDAETDNKRLIEESSLPSSSTDPLPASDLVTDHNGHQLDPRSSHSWRAPLEAVGTAEMAEVMAVNAIAPATLAARLKPLLAKSLPTSFPSFIVNVSAMEGRFSRVFKSAFHPHTNMAKAALNMLTRTSAGDYAKSGIYMTAVDTGWVNEMDPGPRALHKYQKTGFTVPLDEVDVSER